MILEEQVKKLMAELDAKNEELKALKQQKSFGLVWENKPDEKVKHAKTNIPVLCEVSDQRVTAKKNEIGGLAFDKGKERLEPVEHTLVKGDNYLALLALLPKYRGKVNCIYIDPPYNTGNKDFIYNDRFVEEEDSWRHSNWLSFMEPRLKLAKELLTSEGAIFISIDDYEQAHLRVLADSIFGEANFITSLAVSFNPKGRTMGKFFANNHEYILVYTKDRSTTELNPNLKDLVDVSSYNRQDERGSYRLPSLRNTNKNFTPSNRPNLSYAIYVDTVTLEVGLDPGAGKVEVWPTFSDGSPGVWSWGKTKFQDEKELVVPVKQKSGWSIYRKNYLTDDKAKKVKTHLTYAELGSTDEANKLLSSIMGGDSFSYPKHPNTIKLLVSLMPRKDSIVLDFFAGSGTTGQAVAELNAKDGGSRKCILVTDAGKAETDATAVNIADEVTYERMRRCLTGEDWANGEDHPSLEQGMVTYEVTTIPTVKKVATDWDEDGEPIGFETLSLSDTTIESSVARLGDLTIEEAENYLQTWRRVKRRN